MSCMFIGGLTGKELKQLRAEVGLTQEDLALRLKTSSHTIWRWETGGHIPAIKVPKILEALMIDRNVYAEHKEKKRLEAREGREKIVFELTVPGGWLEDFANAQKLLNDLVKAYLIKHGVPAKKITKAMIYGVLEGGGGMAGTKPLPSLKGATQYYTKCFNHHKKDVEQVVAEAIEGLDGITFPHYDIEDDT